jgi:FMN-dependent NADH-azoreductase
VNPAQRVRTEFSGGTGAYQGGLAGLDHQRPYLGPLLGFMGITDRREIVIDASLGEDGEANVKRAVSEARKLAASF